MMRRKCAQFSGQLSAQRAIFKRSTRQFCAFHVRVQSGARKERNDVEPYQLRERHGGCNHLILGSNMFESAFVLAVKAMNFRFVDVVVGDPGHKSPPLHSLDAPGFVEGCVVHRAEAIGQPLEVELHLQE
jgi:hypothetical protein